MLKLHIFLIRSPIGDFILKRILAATFLLLCMTMLLLFPSEALTYTLTGLTLWWERMIPALFPFMMMSQLLICFDLIPVFLTLFRPILKILYRLPDAGLYSVLTGFLCGFPMGAKTVADLHRRGQLPLSMAQTLLNFCNQIGPVYFISFAYPILHRICPAFPLPVALMGMYGIPLCFGIKEVFLLNQSLSPQTSRTLSAAENITGFPGVTEPNFDAIVTGNLIAISRLAGYMMFFPVFLVALECFPQALQHTRIFLYLKSLSYLLLEITGGLSFLSGLLQDGKAAILLPPAILVVLCMGALQFGGLSCLFQTKSMIRGTSLSLGSYLKARIKMTLLCVIFCAVSSFCW